MRKKKSGIVSTVVLVIILLVGLSVMLYPTISNWWNTRAQRASVSNYQAAVAEIDNSKKEEMIEKAREYNLKLAGISSPFSDKTILSDYYGTLDVSGTGIMGFISIPCISVELPIYHGTSPAVLNIAAGHFEGSSFPVSGENVHAVISAHRGLPSAKLFTDLDKLVVGDIFTVTILDEIFTYEVEEIFIVNPEEVDKLAIIPGGDYVTLMTCTPYGINTHRLLIRSHRIETIYERSVKVDADAFKLDELTVIPFIASPLVVFLISFWFFGGKGNKNRTKRDYLNIISKLKEAS